MLEIEWSGGEDFTEDLSEAVAESESAKARMFHGTIDLICSSDDDYDSEMPKIDGSRTTMPKEAHKEDASVDPEVLGVVNDMLDFVKRNELIPEFEYDPDHEVKVEVVAKKEGSCNKPHCLKGCLCSSLGGRFPHGPTHCGRERCMFECFCQERGLQTMDDENHYTDKSKRKKKLPTRFKDVVLGKAYEKLHARSVHDYFNSVEERSESDDECHRMTERMKTSSGGSSKNPSPELKNNATDFVCPMKKKSGSLTAFDKASIATVRKTIQERRVGFLSRTLDEEQTLADVQIWCTQHEKYSCLCINYVFFQKTNALLWKPSNASRYLANKVMYDIALKTPTPVFNEVYPYNHNTHSARTQGPITNYAMRNKDEVFQSKRKLEIEYNILSYSNSYMKFYVRKYPCITKPEHVPSAEPYDKSLVIKGMGDVVHISKTKEKLILDVGKENFKMKVNYVIEEDNEVVENGECISTQKTKQPRRRRKPTMKMIQLEEDRKRETADVESPEKEEPEKTEKIVVAPPVQEKKRRGRKPKHLVMMERRASQLSDRSAIREPTPEVDIIRCSNSQLVKTVDEVKAGMRADAGPVSIKEEPSSPDYFSAESRMDLEDAKEEAIVCAPDVGIVASCGPSETSITTHVTMAPSVSPCSSKTEKDRLDEEFREDIPKPFLGFSDGNDTQEFEECDDPDNDDPDSIHSKKVLILKPRKDGYPHSGLMCLTPGLGYVIVLEYFPGRIVISDPGVPDMKHTFDNLGMVNAWLNTYIRGKVAISPPDLTLQWILVKPGILKLKQVKPLDTSIFWNSAVVITPNGIIDKKSLENPSNSLVLRQQLSEHSVFSPVIRKQLAMREAATKFLKNFVSNPKFSESNLVPNPKSMLRRLLKRHHEEESEAPPPKVPAISESSVSFETADGCVTMHRLSSDSDVRVQTVPQVLSVRPSFAHRLITTPLPLHAAPRDLEIRHQVTIRPLPSLTKIRPHPSFKQAVKILK